MQLVFLVIAATEENPVVADGERMTAGNKRICPDCLNLLLMQAHQGEIRIVVEPNVSVFADIHGITIVDTRGKMRCSFNHLGPISEGRDAICCKTHHAFRPENASTVNTLVEVADPYGIFVLGCLDVFYTVAHSKAMYTITGRVIDKGVILSVIGGTGTYQEPAVFS